MPLRFGAMLFACAAITYFLPLGLASKENILSAEQVRAKAFAMTSTRGTGDAETPLQALVEREALLDSVRANLNAGSAAGLHTFDDLRAKLDIIDRVHPTPKPEVKFLGFAESKVHYLYFCAYLFLICHLWRTCAEAREPRLFRVYSRSARQRRRRAQLRVSLSAALACGLIALSWLTHSWLRANILANHGRSVYSFVNEDIGPGSYGFLLARSLVLCAMIAISWAWWSDRLDTVRRRVAVWRDDGGNVDPIKNRGVLRSLHRRSTAVRSAYESWQLHSIFLSAVFVPWMFYYWSLQDTRYYMSNLTMQIVWGITWWFVSAPALHAARAFERYRSNVVARLNMEASDDKLIAAVRSESPVSFANAVASGIAASAAYLVPFLQKLLG